MCLRTLWVTLDSYRRLSRPGAWIESRKFLLSHVEAPHAWLLAALQTLAAFPLEFLSISTSPIAEGRDGQPMLLPRYFLSEALINLGSGKGNEAKPVVVTAVV